MTQTVKLAKLKQSDKNVRRTLPTNIPAMAASIRARGILQNLLVTPSKPRGMFEIIAGNRRFLGAMMLAEEGAIAATEYDVPVKVVTGDAKELREISTLENVEREDLTPADECRAYHHFIETDGDIDAVAIRFHKTRRFVEGRLRLANLAAPIFEALANGDITLDMAKAYGSTDDQAKQERVFAQYGQHSYINADQIRRAIANDTMKATDPVAILVGEDAYAAAGGRVERELFSEDGDRWSDPELAQSLAATIMEAEAKRLGEEQGLAWIRPIASTNLYGATANLHRVPLEPAPLTETEETRSAEIAARMEIISEEIEGSDEETYAILKAEYEALQAEYEGIHYKAPVLPEEIKGQVGTFLMLDRAGKLVLETSYFSETPLRALGDTAEPRATGGTRNTGSLPPEAIAPGGKKLSAKLHDELAVQRRDILAASILADPGLALDYALFAMVDRSRNYGRSGTTITAGRPNDPQMPPDFAPTQAKLAIAEAREALDTSWSASKEAVDRFEAFRALDDDAKAAWLVMVVGDSLEAKQDYGAVTTNPLHARLASILEIDVAKWWRPNVKNFFNRVSKGTCLATLTEVGGATLAARYIGSKKGDIESSCERLFAGEAITEAETKEAALAWVPDAMRFDAVGSVGLVEDTDPGDDDTDVDGDGGPDGEELSEDEGSDLDAVNDGTALVAAE